MTPAFDWGNDRAVKSASLDEINNALGNIVGASSLKNMTKKLMQVSVSVSDHFVGRKETIDLVLASLVSGVPMVLMGEPGLAKSAIVNKIVEVCGGSRNEGEYFEYLLTSHTMPENIFGPPDLKELREGNIHTNTAGMLPKASVAFLDEVFRGSPHILNTLLSVINERKFFNGKDTDKVPLIGVIGASNDLTSNPELDAFVDRFPVRHWMKSVMMGSGDKAVQLMKKSLAANNGTGSEDGALSFSLNHLRACRIYVDRVAADQVNKDEFNTYSDAFCRMKQQFTLSDRSFSAIFRMGCAYDIVRYGELKGMGPTELLKHVARDSDGAKRSMELIEKLMPSGGVGGTV